MHLYRRLLTKATWAVCLAIFSLSFESGYSQEERSVQLISLVSGVISSGLSIATDTITESTQKRVFVAAVSSRPNVDVATVSGLGLDWRRVIRQCSGRNSSYIDIWLGVGDAVESGSVIATFTEAVDNAVISVSGYDGVLNSAPVSISSGANSNGIQGLCSDGIDSNTYSFDLAATAAGGLIYSAAIMRSRSHTPTSGFTEIAEIRSGDLGKEASLAVQISPVELAALRSVSGKFSRTVDWAAAAFELRPDTSRVDPGDPTFVTLSTNSIGTGTVTVDPPGGSYRVGQQITLTAVPEEAWQFAAWDGDLAGADNPAVITIVTDFAATAIFTEIPLQEFQLSVETSGQGEVIIVPEQETYTEDTSVGLTAVAADGWRFNGWSGAISGPQNPQTITMDSDKVVRADFVDNRLAGTHGNR